MNYRAASISQMRSIGAIVFVQMGRLRYRSTRSSCGRKGHAGYERAVGASGKTII